MRLSTLLLLCALLCTTQNLRAAFVASPIVADQEATTEADAKAAVAAYEAELAALPAHERRALKRQQRREIKQTLKKYKKAKRDGASDADTNTILLAILAILLPPLAVFLYTEEVGTKFWISVILTLLLWLPGVIYALLVITGNAKK